MLMYITYLRHLTIPIPTYMTIDNICIRHGMQTLQKNGRPQNIIISLTGAPIRGSGIGIVIPTAAAQ